MRFTFGDGMSIDVPLAWLSILFGTIACGMNARSAAALGLTTVLPVLPCLLDKNLINNCSIAAKVAGDPQCLFGVVLLVWLLPRTASPVSDEVRHALASLCA